MGPSTAPRKQPGWGRCEGISELVWLRPLTNSCMRTWQAAAVSIGNSQLPKSEGSSIPGFLRAFIPSPARQVKEGRSPRALGCGGYSSFLGVRGIAMGKAAPLSLYEHSLSVHCN